MNLLKLSWKNIWARPLSAALSLILFALGIGLITVLLLINKQLEEQFDNNLAGIDLIVGAKGSPLQLILCNMYHVDSPTGNVDIAEIKPFLNPKHPLIERAVPISVGDNYKKYRIIGTTHEYVSLYEGKLEQGKWWINDMEVVIGKLVADKLHLHVGDEFLSSHGFDDNDDLIHDHDTPFSVVGILEGSGTVLDQLILTNTSSVWSVHGHDDASHSDSSGTEEAHDHSAHDHDHDHSKVAVDDGAFGDIANAELLEHPEEEVTAILIQFKNNNFQTLNMARSINENTDMQASGPAFQINKLRESMSAGTEALRALAFLIAFVSGLSIFFSLLSSLKDRKYELSLMRVMGAGRSSLFLLIILEGILLALMGFLAGWILAHIGTHIFAGRISDQFQYSMNAWRLLPQEIWIALVSVIIGIVASLIPAWQAYRTDIHDTLSDH